MGLASADEGTGVPTPRVSVCIPAYEAEPYIATTLRCILADTSPSVEVVVLDNASTDGTSALVEAIGDPRVRLLHNDATLSLPDNWNRVVELSTAPLVKIVCADDLVHPSAVARQAALLEADARLAVVASRRHLLDDGGQVLAANTGLRGLVGRYTGRQVVARVVRNGGNPIGESSAVMFRRRDFDAVGGFDGSLVFPMDLDLWVKLLAYGDFLGMPETLAAFRASANSASSQRLRSQYEEQLTLTRRLASDPYWRVGRRDKLLSHLGAPMAKLRRELLFTASRWSHRGALQHLLPTTDTEWLRDFAGPPGLPPLHP
ncbi:MAG: glycosyl transferase family protein [Friedmanniella sp.]|nr:glycosyl transferase family protein [Friedmanniella sp.]